MNALALIQSISEPIEPIPDERIIACPVCLMDGTQDFDDPAECPECAGRRYTVV